MESASPSSVSADAVPDGMTYPHFIGIGGAGMSGLAKILAMRGARVSGSDAKESTTVLALRGLGAEIAIGHAAAHLPADADSVIVSSAIREDNPELLAARERGLRVVHRSDALAALMRGRRCLAVAGTHGKTSTTSMLAVSLTALGWDPSFAVGGDLNDPGSNAHHGRGEIFVAEADESDRSFHAYRPDVAIVLNVELDHHANYASLEEVYASFETFVDQIRPGGTLVVSADDAGAVELAQRADKRADLTVLRVGRADDADARLTSVTPHGMSSEISVALPEVLGGQQLSFTVSVPGRHNAGNAVAALVAAAALDVAPASFADAVADYQGVRRRLQPKGSAAGVQVIDSYAHHPTEIAADIEAIRENAEGGRVLVIYQPHLYSRTQQLGVRMGQALATADLAVVMDIYPAREDPVPGVTSAIVADAARATGPADVRQEHGMADVPTLLASLASPGDLVLTMGAGDVTFLGPEILAALEG